MGFSENYKEANKSFASITGLEQRGPDLSKSMEFLFGLLQFVFCIAAAFPLILLRRNLGERLLKLLAIPMGVCLVAAVVGTLALIFGFQMELSKELTAAGAARGIVYALTENCLLLFTCYLYSKRFVEARKRKRAKIIFHSFYFGDSVLWGKLPLQTRLFRTQERWKIIGDPLLGFVVGILIAGFTGSLIGGLLWMGSLCLLILQILREAKMETKLLNAIDNQIEAQEFQARLAEWREDHLGEHVAGLGVFIVCSPDSVPPLPTPPVEPPPAIAESGPTAKEELARASLELAARAKQLTGNLYVQARQRPRILIAAGACCCLLLLYIVVPSSVYRGWSTLWAGARSVAAQPASDTLRAEVASTGEPAPGGGDGKAIAVPPASPNPPVPTPAPTLAHQQAALPELSPTPVVAPSPTALPTPTEPPPTATPDPRIDTLAQRFNSVARARAAALKAHSSRSLNHEADADFAEAESSLETARRAEQRSDLDAALRYVEAAEEKFKQAESNAANAW